MEYEYRHHNGAGWVECTAGLLSGEREALDLVAACGEHAAHRLLIPAACLPPAFFNLSTGLAGAVMLKFSNYRLRVAAVLPAGLALNGRFAEMVLETNRGAQFRFFPARAAALAWLTAQP